MAPSHNSPGRLPGPHSWCKRKGPARTEESHSRTPRVIIPEHAGAVDLPQNSWESWVGTRREKNEAGPSWAAQATPEVRLCGVHPCVPVPTVASTFAGSWWGGRCPRLPQEDGGQEEVPCSHSGGVPDRWAERTLRGGQAQGTMCHHLKEKGCLRTLVPQCTSPSSLW